ncbi:MAG: sulfate respiration complex protein HmcE [Pseudomonadota bacterium]
MYAFVTGPLAWLSFLIFFIGVIARAVMYVKGLDWKLDRVPYGHFNRFGVRGAVRSVVSWLIPFGTHGWRQNPGFTLLVFVFHIGLLVTPVFLLAHNVILKERWGFSLWTFPEVVGDGLTVAMLVAALFIVLRRIALPEVRILTTAYDYLLLLIATGPFITGFIAYHHMGDYHFWIIAHILSGELWLIAVPFTKLSHFILFFMSRIQLGMDYGIKRGGMKGTDMAW